MRTFLSRIGESFGTENLGITVLAVAVGFGLYDLGLTVARDILLPLVNATIGTDLIQQGFHVGHGDDLILNEVRFGRLMLNSFALLVPIVLAGWLLPRKRRRDEAEMSSCPFCLSDVPSAAVKCAYCASFLPRE